MIKSTSSIQPSIEFLPLILRQAYADGKVIDSTGNHIPCCGGVSLAEAVELYRIIRRLKPSVSVEIGLGYGISTLAILQGLQDNGNPSIHHVIDPYQAGFKDAGLVTISRAGLESMFKFHRSFAEEVIPGLHRVQFAFIDSSHLFDLTIEEFVLVDKKLETGGYVVLHDMWMPAQQKALRYILANRPYEVIREFAAPEFASTAALPRSFKSMVKSFLLKPLRVFPGRNRIFSQEFMNPWDGMGIPNMVVLCKCGEDHRDWRLHQPF